MPVSQKQDTTRELTVFTVTGELTFEAQMEEALRWLEAEAPAAEPPRHDSE